MNLSLEGNAAARMPAAVTFGKQSLEAAHA